MGSIKYIWPITILLSGTMTWAADKPSDPSLRFVSVDKCKKYFSQMTSKPSGQTDVAYCKDKITTDPVDICLDTKTSEYLTKYNMTSLDDMINSEKTVLVAKLKYDCQLQAQQAQAVEAQTQATAAQQAAAQQAAQQRASGSNSGRSVTSGMQEALAASQIARAGVQVYDNADKKVEAARTAASAQTSLSEQQSATSRENLLQIKNSERAESEVSAGTPVAVMPTVNVTPKPSETQAQNTSEAATVNPQESIRQSEFAQQNIKSQAADIINEKSQLTSSVNRLKDNAAGANASVSVTEITITASDANKILKENINMATRTAKKSAFTENGISPSFTSTAAEVNSLNQAVEKYFAAKELCTSIVEKTEVLCVEQKSPGAIAAKEVMNSAGPILSIISSAQNACSTTAKVTRFVNTGLTIAKGVCVASKLACDASCASAAGSLKKIQAELNDKMSKALHSDSTNSQSVCSARAVSDAGACYTDYAARAQAASTMVSQINQALNTEAAPTTGTSPGLVVKCNSYVKDIVLFGVQLLGTYAAQKNAQQCADKLASGGTPAVTVPQYCSVPANAATDFCKCNANNNAPGCPGAIAAAAAIKAQQESGTNIKAVSGNSAFATGYRPIPPKTGLTNSTGSDSTTKGMGTAADLVANTNSATNGSTSGAATTGSSSGSTTSAASDAGSGQKGDVADKKPWSFGSFSSIAGSLGFSGSGSNKNPNSGALSSKQLEAVKRKVASEQLAAEVSTASGKSNWEKIRNMYSIKQSSFIVGQ